MGDYMLSAKEGLFVSAVIRDQVHLLWVSVLTGFFLCLLFDLFRAVRRVKSMKNSNVSNGWAVFLRSSVYAVARKNDGLS